MSESNVEVVRSLLGSFEGLDVAGVDWGAEPIRELLDGACSSEVELRTLESGVGTGVDAEYHGVDGVVRYLQDWIEPFAEYHAEFLEYIDLGDFVLVATRNWGVGSGSGARTDLDLVYACEVKNGLITRMLQYDTLEDARAAIGAGV
jgi:SnoaL-like domain